MSLAFLPKKLKNNTNINANFMPMSNGQTECSRVVVKFSLLATFFEHYNWEHM